MNTLLFTLLGIMLAYYIFPLFDMGIGVLNNYFSLFTAKIQAKINELASLQEPQDTNMLGFDLDPSHMEDSYYNYEDDYDEGFENKNRNKIGF